MIALLVMTDGRRDCIKPTIASASANLSGNIRERWIHDDSGDLDYADWLDETFPAWRIVHTPGRSGFGGAIRSAWSALLGSSTADHVFHLEDDFIFNRPVDLDDLARTLEDQPHLVQLAFRRQPWNRQERRAGGIVEMHPDDYTERSDGVAVWLEHRRNFTTNPSLYRRSLIVDHDWPDGAESEGRFGISLMAEHPEWRFAYWGSRDSGEWVTHIGHQRIGIGY